MISELFNKLSAQNRAALVAFVSCGDPSLDFTKKLVKTVCRAGADIVELGVPFSDPMADGAAIQASSQRALAAGTTILSAIEMAGDLRKDGIDKPFVLFSYFNPIFKLGVSKIAAKCKENGIDALLVVDVPLEESGQITSATKEFGLDFIPLAAPTSPLDRVENISKSGSGFLYYVTVAGVTGVRDSLPEHLARRLADVRRVSKLPVAAGFGISNPQMARLAAESADAVVVGSRLVSLAHETLLKEGEPAALEAVSAFVKSLSESMCR